MHNESGAHHSPGAHKTRPHLASRGRPARTFGGLLAFTATLFLCCGVYLIAEPLAHPIAEHDVGVIAGAFIIALASILLFYLVKPGASHGRAPVEPPTEPSAVGGEEQVRPDLPLGHVRMRRTRARP